MILRDEEKPEDSRAKPKPIPSITANKLSHAGETIPDDMIDPIIIYKFKMVKSSFYETPMPQ
jgi:hypothetical protein